MQQTTQGQKSGSDVLTVGLAQINNSFSGQNYLPYAIGLLQAYAERHAEAPGKFRFLLPVYKRIKVEAAVEQLRDADAVGFFPTRTEQIASVSGLRCPKTRTLMVMVVTGGGGRDWPFGHANERATADR